SQADSRPAGAERTGPVAPSVQGGLAGARLSRAGENAYHTRAETWAPDEAREESVPMKIILANPRGFCAGVNMAIRSLERSLHLFGAPLYVYHEIVHNKYVVERFRKRGVVFVEDLDEVPEGAPLLYSAHGVSPQIREQSRRRKLQAIDATCPLV